MSSDAREAAHPSRRPPRGAAADTERAVVPQPIAPVRPGLTPLSLLIVLIVGYLLIQIQFVLVLILLSLVFATVISTPVDALERRHVPRPLAILLVYIGIIAGLTVLSIGLAPAIREQSAEFRTQAPQSLQELQQTWQESGNALLNGPGQQMLERALVFLDSPSQLDISVPQGAALGVLTGLGGGVIGIVTVLIISFYYLMERQWIRRIALGSAPAETRIRVIRIWDEVEQKVGDWLRGQLTLCLVIGVTATVGYAIMGIKFWPLLGLWAGITEIIPILGPWLGGVPAVIIALTQSWEKAAIVVVFVVLLQMMENAILVPRVMRGAVGLSPLTVFIAILAGTEFAGVAGALLAIPVAAAIQVMISNYTQARREERLAGMSSLPGWRWMRGSVAPVAATAAPVTTPVVPVALDVVDVAEPATAAATGWSSRVLSRARGRHRDAPAISRHDDDGGGDNTSVSGNGGGTENERAAGMDGAQ